MTNAAADNCFCSSVADVDPVRPGHNLELVNIAIDEDFANSYTGLFVATSICSFRLAGEIRSRNAAKTANPIQFRTFQL
jgi:hypothetical protein